MFCSLFLTDLNSVDPTGDVFHCPFFMGEQVPRTEPNTPESNEAESV